MVNFFLGIRLPKELEERCESLRRAFKAPRTVAHITVCAPFDWVRKPGDLVALLESSLNSTRSFEIKGAGIGSFGTRVLFVNVQLSPELAAVQKQLSWTLKEEGIPVDTRPYHPHITLATRLRPAEFDKYRARLGDFSLEYSFICSNVALFRFTKEGRWEDWTQMALSLLG
ncbi:MAG TPA: hypothetical protein DDW87_06690 [Firmicutes bacterium]|nr:hypothetical protein [Bacillota bacterium]